MDVKAAASHSDINAVLQQMRQIRDQTQRGLAPAPREIAAPASLDAAAPGAAPAATRADFGGALQQAINAVSGLQKTAAAGANGFAAGTETDLVKVMIDAQKANVGFQAMVQVRNRMVTAYQDIMNMPI